MMLRIEHIKNTYEPHSNEVNAEVMTRYMRNQFPFLGVRQKESVLLDRQLFKEHELPAGRELKSLAQQLFQEDEWEYHYIAIRLLGKQKETLHSEDLPFIETLLLQRSWWDSVDTISPDIVGPIVALGNEGDLIRMRQWTESDNFWMQRAGLLHQLKFKEKMNEKVLIEMIEQLKEEKEFFIRKAIGWVLREYSKTASDFVIDYVSKASLSPLSEREALKWLTGKGVKV